MTNIDYAIFLVIGAVGALVDARFAWIGLSLWAVLKLLHVI